MTASWSLVTGLWNRHDRPLFQHATRQDRMCIQIHLNTTHWQRSTYSNGSMRDFWEPAVYTRRSTPIRWMASTAPNVVEMTPMLPTRDDSRA